MNTAKTIDGETSLFKLSEYRFVGTHISIGEGQLNTHITTKIKIASTKEDDENSFHLKLTAIIFNDDKTLEIESSLAGKFILKKEDFDDIEKLMRVDAVIYLYPYLRSYISALTSLSNIASFDLPIVDDSFFKDLYKKEKAKKKKAQEQTNKEEEQ